MSQQATSTSSNIPQLILYPVDPDWCVALRETLQQWLVQLEFIGTRLASNRFEVGEAFLHYISFLGCSPAIDLAVPDGMDETSYLQHLTHVYLSPSLSRPRLIYDIQQARPRCPQCGQLLVSWQNQLKDDVLHCDSCGHKDRPDKFRWRQRAAYASQFISVLNVYPQEAVPTDAFLNQLAALSGVNWQHAYCQCPLITETA